MAVTDGFYARAPDEQAQWPGQYGASAPYFWAAQSGAITFEGPAAGFLNLPPGEQATWYGTYRGGRPPGLGAAGRHERRGPAEPAQPSALRLPGGRRADH